MIAIECCSFPGWRSWRAGLTAVAVWLLASTCHAADWTLPELMNLLAQQKSGRASFVEKKTMAVLDKPLESSGELSFDAPDRLEKRTFKPHAESMLLEGNNLTVALHGKRAVQLRLQEHPAVAATVESIRGTLAGDLVALERNYSVALNGSPSKWQLTLVPVNVTVARIVQSVQIVGTQADIKTIRLDQADGDRSEMTISKISTP